MSSMPLRAAHHHLRRMTGRDPSEEERPATPLELLYDLVLVVAFGVAGNQLAHALADGHYAVASVGFSFAMFACVWAWINYTWFASAFDTDDWFVRVAVMVQMAGVLILALGIPDFFHGLEDGWAVEIQVLVGGYVVMRLAMITLWLRVAREAEGSLGRTARGYAIAIAVAQVGWILAASLHLSLAAAMPLLVGLFVVEMGWPYIAENGAAGTPWHAHHIAERYALLAIIALGEGIIGTTASLEALIGREGWSRDAAAVLVAGVSLTVGMWWVYFSIPMGEVLARFRGRSFVFGYTHLLIYASIAAVGAGLHVAAYWIEGEAKISLVATVATVALPTALFLGILYAFLPAFVPGVGLDPFHLLLVAGTAAVLLCSLVLAGFGAPLAVCLSVAMLAPWVSVIGFEAVGHRHLNDRLAAAHEPDPAAR